MQSKIVLGSILSGGLVYLGLPMEAINILALLMFTDFITGVVGAYVDNKKDVKSETAIKGLIKKVSIFLVPFIVALMLKGSGYESNGIITTILSILIVSEGYSILGNIYTIKTGKKVTEIDALGIILKKVKELIDDNTKK